MSFAGLLGAGLLGGVANSAKGVGDKIREEAKQKRAMALVDQAQANAVALQEEVAEDNIEWNKSEQREDWSPKMEHVNRRAPSQLTSLDIMDHGLCKGLLVGSKMADFIGKLLPWATIFITTSVAREGSRHTGGA